MDFTLPILVAITSATAAFLFALAQKRIDFFKRRKSVAIAIMVEISEAKTSLSAHYIRWEVLMNELGASKPLLVNSSDINVLSRIHLEDYNFPPAVVNAVMRFYNSVNDYYTCVSAINSQKFLETSIDRQRYIVSSTVKISENVVDRAEIAIAVIKKYFPLKWFENQE